MAARAAILKWIRWELQTQSCAEARALPVDDLTRCMRDGNVLCALALVLSGGAFEWKQVETASERENCERALSVFEANGVMFFPLLFCLEAALTLLGTQDSPSTRCRRPP
jgi:hypothetical protein